jgi:phage shock protein A
MRDITVATLNEQLAKAEDPIRLIDRFLAEQKELVIQAEKLFDDCLNHARMLKRQYLEAEHMKEKREQQAVLAVKAGEDDAARLALQEKMIHEEESARYKTLYEQARETLLELEERLNQLKAEMEEVLLKRQYYAARMESLRLKKMMNERMRHRPYGTTSRIFDRLEEQVAEMEWESEALSEIRGREHYASSRWDVRQTVEHELEQIKKKLEQKGREDV